VADVHTATAVALQTDVVHGFGFGLTIGNQLLVFFPLVGNHCTTTKTSYWNNHHLTSSIRLLFLASSTTAELVLGLLSAWVVHEQAAVETQVLIAEFFVNALSATVVVDQTAGDGGANSVGLTHDATAVGGDEDVNLAQPVHGIGDDQWLHRLSTGQRRLKDFNGL
jgi:hypothetical protein